MKRLFLLIFLILLPRAALAQEAVSPADTEAARRLEALRYTLSPAAALTEEDVRALLANDLFDEPLTPDDLFETDADFGPTGTPAEALMYVPEEQALSLGWEDARILLSRDASYSLTEQGTGASIRLRYAGEFEHSAIFQPVTGWDGATLGSMFSDCYDFRLIPCAITIGSESYLAGLSVTPGDVDGESGTPLLCRLYFEHAFPALGKLSGLGME